jgi:hypothetical protein
MLALCVCFNVFFVRIGMGKEIASIMVGYYVFTGPVRTHYIAI